jgi:hypothetical protein
MNEKLGGPLDSKQTLERLNESPQFVLLPLLPEETADLAIDRAVGEMHDPLIAGAVRRLQIPLLTRDPQITASGIVVTLRARSCYVRAGVDGGPRIALDRAVADAMEETFAETLAPWRDGPRSHRATGCPPRDFSCRVML